MIGAFIFGGQSLGSTAFSVGGWAPTGALTSQLGTADSQLGVTLLLGLDVGLNGEPSRAIPIPAGAIGLDAPLPAMRRTFTYLALAGAVTLAGLQPVVDRERAPLPGAGAVTLAGLAPVVDREKTPLVSVGAVSVVGLTPRASVFRVAPPGTLAVTGVTTIAKSSGGSSTSLTFAHRSDGNPLYLLLDIWQQVPFSVPTYGGVAFTPGDFLPLGNHRLAWYVLPAPVIGTANVFIDLAFTWCTAAAVNVQGAVSRPGVMAASGTGTAASLTTVSGPNRLVIDFLAEQSVNQVFTPGGSQTLLAALSLEPNGDLHAAVSSQAGAASVTMAWTLANSVAWAQMALSFETSLATIPAGAIALAGLQPVVDREKAPLPGVGAITLAGLAPLTRHPFYAPAPGTLAISGYVTSGKTDGPTSPLTLAHIADGNPLFVLLVVANTTVSSVTFGGVPLTLGGRADIGASDNVEWWYRLAPTPGSAPLVITAGFTTWISAAAFNVQGVTHLPGWMAATSLPGSTATPSLVVPTAPGKLVIDLVEEFTAFQTFTPAAGQTKESGQDLDPNNDAKSATSSRVGASPAVTMAWTLAVAGPCAQLALTFESSVVWWPLNVLGAITLAGLAPSVAVNDVPSRPTTGAVALAGLAPALGAPLSVFYAPAPGPSIAVTGYLSYNTSNAGLPSLVLPHLADGNPLIVFAVVHVATSNTVTYGGVPLTLGGRMRPSGDGTGTIELWYEWWYLETPVAGSASLVLTFSSATTRATAYAVNLRNARVSAGHVTFVAVTATNPPLTLTVNTQPDGLVLDLVNSTPGFYSVANQVFTPIPSRPERELLFAQNHEANEDLHAAASMQPGTGAALTMPWGVSRTQSYWGEAALAFGLGYATFPSRGTVAVTGLAPSLSRTETFPNAGHVALIGLAPALVRTELLLGAAFLALQGRTPILVTSQIFMLTGSMALQPLLTYPMISAPPAVGDFFNAGFERGDASGWVTGTGNRANIDNSLLKIDDYLPGGALYNPGLSTGPATHSGIVTKHLVPQTGNQLNAVFSGTYAWRVEDRTNQGWASAIAQRVNAYAYPEIFFAWAAVLEQAHGIEDSSTIKIRLTDETLGGIVLLSREYNAAIDGSGVDARFQFEPTTGFYWTPWQIEEITIPEDSIGHDLRLAILAADCFYSAHAGWLYLDKFGPVRPEAHAFKNAALTTGLTWIIVTLHSGVQYVWSDRPLPDPSTYYLGWKEPRVTKWGRIRRALSNVLDGQYETTDFRVTLDDNDHLLRDLGDDLVNATVAVYMIPDEGRRRLEIPTTVYRGVIREAKPNGVLLYDLTIKDSFAETFGTTGTFNA